MCCLKEGRRIMKRKEIKKQVAVDFAAYEVATKERKEALAKLSDEQKQAAIKSDKIAKKLAKKERKKAISNMPKQEKKAAKYYDKKLKKRKQRKVRWSINGLILLLIIVAGMKAAPFVGNIASLLNRTDLVDSSTPEAQKARAEGFKLAEQISDEGIVLLKNDNNTLPLTNQKVNVFGLASNNIRYGGGGSGGADQSKAIDLFQGLENAGIQYNNDLYQLNKNHKDNPSSKAQSGFMAIVSMLSGNANVDEPTPDYLTDEVLQNAKKYSGIAIIVIGLDGVESSDMTVDALRLTPNKLALIDRVSEYFDDIVILVNAGNAMELRFVDDYPQIKSVLWVGTPGAKGMNSLGNILAGNSNPSGRLTDTYAYNVKSSPASVNFGDYQYSNMNMAFINYNEGIYIGYRFYETYYANDEAGYKEAVQYPFGYGMSYTDFTWDVGQPQFDGDKIQIDVKVTNAGTVDGKDVVQLYFSPPYIPGGIEKSFIELGAYDKTNLLHPGESQVLTLSYDTRDMASYDMNNTQAFVLDPGTYDIKVARNVHDIVKSMPYQVADRKIYNTDDATGTPIENHFDYANGNLEYLSRNAWEKTFPNNDNLNYSASQELLDAIGQKPAKVKGEIPTMGADNGIMLSDLKGLAYDDPKWDDFLDQYTLAEMKDLFLDGAYRTVANERLGVPSATLFDGPAGLNFFFGNLESASYPTESVIAATWNNEIAYKMGEAIGTEANAIGVQGWYAPGMNLHRTPQGGRNFEYYSEDPLLSGKMSASMVSGAQSKDLLVFMKHFALNEQETNARTGLMTWTNEQALRELYLKPFEITVKEANVNAAMSSFIHIGYKWSGGNPELLQDVLRSEWGFDGMVSTDAVLGGFMDINLALRHGNDLMLAVLPAGNSAYFDKLYKEDPVGISQGVRERVHTVLYSILKTDAVD